MERKRNKGRFPSARRRPARGRAAPPRRAAPSGGTPRSEWDATFNSLADGIAVCGLDGTIYRLNEAMAALFGRPPSALAGANICELMADPAVTDPHACLKEVRRTMKRVSLVRRHGDRSYGIRVDPRTDPSGRLNGAVIVVSDITERLRANDAIKEAGDNLRALVDTSPAAILTLDPEGRVTSWNRSAEKLFGWREDEVLGSPNPIVQREALDEYEEIRRRIMDGDTVSGMTVRRRRKDGSLVDITFTAAPLKGAGGEVTGIVSIILDVTELKRTEEMVRQRDEEVRQLLKMEAIGRLAGGMAHNLNNILTSILGYGELLGARVGSDPALSEYAKAVIQSADRAAALCRQLLTFSRSQVSIMEPLDLNEVLASTSQLLTPLISEDIDLITIPRAGLWTVLGNSSQVQQVLVNMALNSRAAMPNGGKLVIEVSNVELDPEYVKRHPGTRPGEYAMIAVSDTGCGMTVEVRNHLFEPFFTTKEGGNGLGLSTAYGMVAQMGGHISVYSEPGQGTTFKVYIPRTTQTVLATAPRAEPELASYRGTETVLVVEDRAELQHLIGEILGKLGYSVLSARNGVEALRLVKEYGGPMDLVLTDLIMPHMGGLELADLLRHVKPGLRVVFMSGYTDAILRQKGDLPEGYPFLAKPFTPDALGRIVRRTLDAFSRG